MRKTILFVILILLTSFSALLAQATITGTVADSAKGDPLIGANVYLVGTALGSVTNVEGAYRIVGMLEQTAFMLENEVVPRLQQFLAEWRRMTLWLDGALFGGLLALFLLVTIQGGYWDGLSLRLPFWSILADYPGIRLVLLVLLAAAAGYGHFSLRRWVGQRVARRLASDPKVTNHPTLACLAKPINKDKLFAVLQTLQKGEGVQV